LTQVSQGHSSTSSQAIAITPLELMWH
jgi:hypothetical protein